MPSFEGLVWDWKVGVLFLSGGTDWASFAKSKQDSLPWGQEQGDTLPDLADPLHMS